MINRAVVDQEVQSNPLIYQNTGKINRYPEKGLFLARKGPVACKKGIQGHPQKGHGQDPSDDQDANQDLCRESEGIFLTPEPNDPGQSPHAVLGEQDLGLPQSYDVHGHNQFLVERIAKDHVKDLLGEAGTHNLALVEEHHHPVHKNLGPGQSGEGGELVQGPLWSSGDLDLEWGERDILDQDLETLEGEVDLPPPSAPGVPSQNPLFDKEDRYLHVGHENQNQDLPSAVSGLNHVLAVQSLPRLNLVKEQKKVRVDDQDQIHRRIHLDPDLFREEDFPQIEVSLQLRVNLGLCRQPKNKTCQLKLLIRNYQHPKERKLPLYPR